MAIAEPAPGPGPTKDRPPDGQSAAEGLKGVGQAVDRAIAWLVEHQDSDGWWCGELEANVTIQAEYILLMQFLGKRDDARWAEVVHYIDLRQQPDGGWPIYFGGPSDLSTTIEAYVALKLTGRDMGEPRMVK